MFRRRNINGPRPGRPILRPRGNRPPLQIAAQQALQHAHRLLESSQYAAAAQSFERLAEGAQQFEHPRQAAHLFVQAARARLLNGQITEGSAEVQKGLGLFARLGLWEPFDGISQRTIEELRQLGQIQAADSLARWVAATRQGTAVPQGIWAQTSPGALGLPSKCPFCGASVRPNEIEWLDETHAECDYCGSVLSGS